MPVSSTFFCPSILKTPSASPKPNLRLSTSDFILQPPHPHEWQLRYSRRSARNLGWSTSGHNHRSHPKYALLALPSSCTQKFRIQSLLITPPLLAASQPVWVIIILTHDCFAFNIGPCFKHKNQGIFQMFFKSLLKSLCAHYTVFSGC